ncbi:YadA-like family protein [Haemophilus influenzae]
MKRNLLKQSVIAVLVGGAVSNYAAATATNNNDVKKRLDEIDTYIDNILDESEAYEAEVDAKLDQHSAVLGRHTTRLNNLKTIAEKARDDSSEALDKIKALEEQNDEFLADITTLEERVDKNSSRITKAETEVSLLKNRVDGAAGALNLLSQNIGLNKTNIEKKADKTEVDANKAAIATNKAEIATNKTAIDANTANIATNKTAIDANTANIATNKTAIDANTANIIANKTAIATNKTAIDANTANIIANKTAIATNKADIATHTQRLDNLDNRVNNLNKDLKRGLASQAALNGLFQPYNVGKLNLTAAVGGYKSQTAVAVGTGYRHNENVATKAGIAFTHGGSATYNVGVNFEW